MRSQSFEWMDGQDEDLHARQRTAPPAHMFPTAFNFRCVASPAGMYFGADTLMDPELTEWLVERKDVLVMLARQPWHGPLGSENVDRRAAAVGQQLNDTR
jgi:hypothetical protein